MQAVWDWSSPPDLFKQIGERFRSGGGKEASLLYLFHFSFSRESRFVSAEGPEASRGEGMMGKLERLRINFEGLMIGGSEEMGGRILALWILFWGGEKRRKIRGGNEFRHVSGRSRRGRFSR